MICFGAKIGFLFLTILMGVSTLVRAKYEQDITFRNMLALTTGLTGFITMQWLLPAQG